MCNLMYLSVQELKTVVNLKLRIKIGMLYKILDLKLTLKKKLQ